MNIEYEIQKAYKTALDSIGVPVFTDYSVAPDQTYPFIKIGTVQAIQEITNGCKIFNVFVTVEAIDGNINEVGRKGCLLLGGQIENAINPGTDIAIDTPFEIANTFLLNSTTIDNKSGVYFIYQNIRTYQHKINLTT